MVTAPCGSAPAAEALAYPTFARTIPRARRRYTSKLAANARVSGGCLHITALREPCEGCAFSSARLRTKGRGDWRYGR